MKIKNKKRMLIVLGILTVLLSAIGVTYAFYSAIICQIKCNIHINTH